MPKVEVLLLCDQVIQDARSGKNTLVGVFDRIFARQFPATHPQMNIYAVVSGAPNQKVLTTLRIVGPGGHLADVPGGETQLSGYGRANIVGNLIGIQLPDLGQYRFQVLVNDEIGGESILFVEQIDTATGSDPTVH